MTIKDQERDLAHMRHTAAHLLAHAVVDLYGPDVKLAIGPAIDNGFYYDFLKSTPFVPEDLERIEARMRELMVRDVAMTGSPISRADADAYYKKLDQPFKLDILAGIPPDEPLSMYTIGEFTDLCRGGHVERSSQVGAVKLLSLAGAYWRGDEKNPMLQRIYGTAFPTQAELDAYLKQLEEAEKRDHRRLGKELDLFSIQEDAGPGLIFWHPAGGRVREVIEEFIRGELRRRGYEPVHTPHAVRERLYEISGHLESFSESMFGPLELDEERYRVKPMNCPGHILIYKSRPRSYRELPLRLAEFGTVYRYERSGTLHGLLRVRMITMDDAHLFCTPDQLQAEFENTVDAALTVLKAFKFDDYRLFVSTKPPNALGDDALWERATEAIKTACDHAGLKYEIDEGGGAFYGPKLDVKVRDAIGREWQLSTVQVDFNLPQRFGLTYTGPDGAEHQPVMIHRALCGSLERFMGVLIEHYAGAFPAWLAPVQAVVLPISEDQLPYAERVAASLSSAGFRVDIDRSNERLQKKIRTQQMRKVPYMLVVGKSEVADGTVNVRSRAGDQATMSLEEFGIKLRDEVIAKT
ncbi:MAG TPA: threonine--tRNA ligase [Candidatus Eremiobacteraceae bacterium]|nr:threonine--tRNA ligase [Candidatus Eremiobacteraceae bacterium]